MSRSEPQITNPTQRYFTWKGGVGNLIYWDKEQEKEMVVKLPFEFFVLDQLTAIVGWSDQQESAFWSNEVRKTSDEITVRTKNGVQATGAYKDLADVKSKGARYAKSIYIAFNSDSGMILGNFKATGASLTAWIEFCNKYNVNNGKVVLKGSETAKKGATTYHIPTFEYEHSTPEEDSIAVELDKELQDYLKQTLQAPSYNRGSADPLPEYQGDDIPIEDIPEEWR